MLLLTRVHGGENAAASRYALVTVDPPFAQRVLAWRALAAQCKTAYPNFYRVTFWAPPIDWGGADPATRLPDEPTTPSPEEPHVDDVIATLIGEDAAMQVLDGTIVQLPEAVTIPERLVDRTECEMMDVTEDGIRFKSYPRDTNEMQETELIPWRWFEQIAAQTPQPSDSPDRAAPALPMASETS